MRDHVFLSDVGFDGTSNVLAGKLFDIPVSGTQAHSFVSSYNALSDVADQVNYRLPFVVIVTGMAVLCRVKT